MYASVIPHSICSILGMKTRNKKNNFRKDF